MRRVDLDCLTRRTHRQREFHGVDFELDLRDLDGDRILHHAGHPYTATFSPGSANTFSRNSSTVIIVMLPKNRGSSYWAR